MTNILDLDCQDSQHSCSNINGHLRLMSGLTGSSKDKPTLACCMRCHMGHPFMTCSQANANYHVSYNCFNNRQNPAFNFNINIFIDITIS